jgi:hypothetical protein
MDLKLDFVTLDIFTDTPGRFLSNPLAVAFVLAAVWGWEVGLAG